MAYIRLSRPGAAVPYVSCDGSFARVTPSELQLEQRRVPCPICGREFAVRLNKHGTTSIPRHRDPLHNPFGVASVPR